MFQGGIDNIMKKRVMWGIEIPEEGPEDPSIEGKLEPKNIEFAGCRWAISTASGICGYIANDQEEFEACMHNMLPKLLEAREEWERGTYIGLRRAAGLYVPPGTKGLKLSTTHH